MKPLPSPLPPRDLPAEVARIRQWLGAHAALSPGSLSVAAGLGRNSLASLLREKDPEKPTEGRLDRLYAVLRSYGYCPEGPGLVPGLALPAVSELLRQLRAGQVLLCDAGEDVGHEVWEVWTLTEFRRRGPQLARCVATGATPTQALARGAAGGDGQAA